MSEPGLTPLCPYEPEPSQPEGLTMSNEVEDLKKALAERNRQLTALHDEVRRVLDAQENEQAATQQLGALYHEMRSVLDKHQHQQAGPKPTVLTLAEALTQMEDEYRSQQQDLADERRARRAADGAYVAYLSTVTTALDAADIPVAHWHADADDPIGGWIALESQRFEDWLSREGQTVWLVWSEAYGWYSGIASDDNSEHLRDLRGSGLDVAATPAEVVAWAHALREHGPRSPSRYTVRPVRDENADDDLWNTLATYAT